MTRDLVLLEAEIETMLGDLSADLDRVPPPGEAVMARVKTAARHEMNERWLAALPTAPAARPGLLEDVQVAVRRELDRQERWNWNRRWNPQLAGGAMAAAMLVLCVGLVWRIGRVPSPQVMADQLVVKAAEHHVSLFLEAAQVALAGDEFNKSLGTDPGQGGTRTESAAETGSDSLLKELDGAIEEVQRGMETGGGSPAASPRSRGVLG
jgi:hypothetical protein